MKQSKVGRRIGKYEVGKTVGQGSFAKVKLAKNCETGQSVALKILNKDMVLKHKMTEQIKREIATMKLIKHPNVIRLYEVDPISLSLTLSENLRSMTLFLTEN